VAKHLIEVPDYDPRRGVVTLIDEGGTVVVRHGDYGVAIEADRAGLLDLARWCLALADEQAPSGVHVHLDPGLEMLGQESASLMLGRDDGLRAD
jgi:hypothetical protein